MSQFKYSDQERDLNKILKMNLDASKAIGFFREAFPDSVPLVKRRLYLTARHDIFQHNRGGAILVGLTDNLLPGFYFGPMLSDQERDLNKILKMNLDASKAIQGDSEMASTRKEADDAIASSLELLQSLGKEKDVDKLAQEVAEHGKDRHLENTLRIAVCFSMAFLYTSSFAS